MSVEALSSAAMLVLLERSQQAERRAEAAEQANELRQGDPRHVATSAQFNVTLRRFGPDERPPPSPGTWTAEYDKISGGVSWDLPFSPSRSAPTHKSPSLPLHERAHLIPHSPRCFSTWCGVVRYLANKPDEPAERLFRVFRGLECCAANCFVFPRDLHARLNQRRLLLLPAAREDELYEATSPLRVLVLAVPDPNPAAARDFPLYNQFGAYSVGEATAADVAAAVRLFNHTAPLVCSLVGFDPVEKAVYRSPDHRRICDELVVPALEYRPAAGVRVRMLEYSGEALPMPFLLLCLAVNTAVGIGDKDKRVFEVECGTTSGSDLELPSGSDCGMTAEVCEG